MLQIVSSSFRKLLGFSRSALAGLGHLSYGAMLQIVSSSFRKLLGFSRSALVGLPPELRGHFAMRSHQSSIRQLARANGTACAVF
jgi:hypothetical protein